MGEEHEHHGHGHGHGHGEEVIACDDIDLYDEHIDELNEFCPEIINGLVEKCPEKCS